jgi:hypothetical protein
LPTCLGPRIAIAGKNSKRDKSLFSSCRGIYIIAIIAVKLKINFKITAIVP